MDISSQGFCNKGSYKYRKYLRIKRKNSRMNANRATDILKAHLGDIDLLEKVYMIRPFITTAKHHRINQFS